MTIKKQISKCFKALRKAGMSYSDAGYTSKKIVKGYLLEDVKSRFLKIEGMSLKFISDIDEYGFINYTFYYKGVELNSYITE